MILAILHIYSFTICVSPILRYAAGVLALKGSKLIELHDVLWGFTNLLPFLLFRGTWAGNDPAVESLNHNSRGKNK